MTEQTPLTEIVTDWRMQCREGGLDPAVVDEYIAALDRGDTFPDVSIYIVDGKKWLVDGWHRLDAHRSLGFQFIRTTVVGEGSSAEAMWAAAGTNQAHGLRRSASDKRIAVIHALDSGIGCDASNRVLAEHCGVSHPFVSKVREQWEDGGPGPDLDEENDAPNNGPSPTPLTTESAPTGGNVTTPELDEPPAPAEVTPDMEDLNRAVETVLSRALTLKASLTTAARAFEQRYPEARRELLGARTDLNAITAAIRSIARRACPTCDADPKYGSCGTCHGRRFISATHHSFKASK